MYSPIPYPDGGGWCGDLITRPRDTPPPKRAETLTLREAQDMIQGWIRVQLLEAARAGRHVDADVWRQALQSTDPIYTVTPVRLHPQTQTTACESEPRIVGRPRDPDLARAHKAVQADDAARRAGEPLPPVRRTFSTGHETTERISISGIIK